MLYLVDTNILLRLCDRNHSLHETIRTAIRNLQTDGNKLQVASQNCVEFRNVATRPCDRNGFGLSSEKADKLLSLVERLFPILPDVPAVYPEWRRLTNTFKVMGIQVHDARLVAIMKVYGITNILTLNTVDFIRYAGEGICTVNPVDFQEIG
jgi:predicted nucleic acid-binding protein